jgi:hypothetical protein
MAAAAPKLERTQHMRGQRARMKHGTSIENHSSWRRFSVFESIST